MKIFHCSGEYDISDPLAAIRGFTARHSDSDRHKTLGYVSCGHVFDVVHSSFGGVCNV